MLQCIALPRRSRRAEESAQTLLWMVALMAVTVFVLMVTARWAAATVASARLDATADLAALAGVVGGEAEARSVAERNGALLTRFVRDGERVEVTVTVDRSTAQASAVPRDVPR